jgi:predicted thioredoxin/glutaredoxin
MEQHILVAFNEFEEQIINEYKTLYTKDVVLGLLRELWNYMREAEKKQIENKIKP